jgi:NAD-dependent deacetylase sirtuin 4
VLTAQASASDIAALLERKRILVLGGAGMSTESGIPDYRGPESSKRPRNPMRFQQFVGSEAARRRYWARSFVGWQRVAAAKPNEGHQALARLETAGHVTGLITQNVDGLHQAAGSKRVLELHGSLAAVRCLACGAVSSRRTFQTALLARNPAMSARALEIAPDGDAELPEEVEAGFNVPACTHCGGVLKPDVVFFGENVPKARVLLAYGLLERADALMVVGSSLSVFSGYRFVVQAAKEGKPIVILNDGETRGDMQATLKCTERLGELLPEIASLLEQS